MRRLSGAALGALGIALLAAGPAPGQAPALQRLGTLPGLVDLAIVDGTLILERADGRFFVPRDGGFAETAARPETPPPGAIPFAGLAKGDGALARAWLAEPTDRYAHGVLGDAVEAGALIAQLRDGRRLVHRLPESRVFEDNTPRLVDTDGDGAAEILTVVADARAGAAPALFAPLGEGLALVARGPFIGRANRWLNPVGAGDFDGDGRAEVAVVETPHIGGKLVLYDRQGRALVERARIAGYSTHPLGSPVLAMAAILDWDGDGADDVLLPSQDRRALAVVAGVEGDLRERLRWSLPAALATRIAVFDEGRIVYGLTNGEVWEGVFSR